MIEMRLLSQIELDKAEPQFLWKRPGYFRAVKSEDCTTLYFNRFPRNTPTVTGVLVCLGLLAGLTAQGFHVGMP
jgi:hypothetical protein